MDVWLLERLAGLARRGSCWRFLLARVQGGIRYAYLDTVSVRRIEEPTAREEARTNLKEQVEAADSSVRDGRAVENVDLPTLQEWEDFLVDMRQSEARV